MIGDRLRPLTMGGGLEFPLHRSALQLYAVLALILSVALLVTGWRRGIGEFSLWLAAYVLLGLLSIYRPRMAPLAGGVSAFLFGFVRTYRGGFNLDLGLGLIALSVGVWVLARVRRGEGRPLPVDLAGLSLLSLAVWSVTSLAFVLVRIHSFRPAPGFGYRPYQLNAFGFSSDEAVLRAAIGTTATFLAFGLYLYARSGALDRRALAVAVFLALLVNGAVLFVQRHVDAGFLQPGGFVPPHRYNGVTSFCYALGDVVLALFLLLPAWGATRGRLGVLTAGSVLLLAYALLASGSRSALVAMLAATLLWAGLRATRLSQARKPLGAAVSLLAAALLLSLAVAAYWLTPPDEATPLGRLKTGIEQEGLLRHLFVQRLHVYPLAFRVMAEYPLSGVGAGLYLAEISKQRALLAPDLEVLEPYLLTSYAPSQFLNTGVELGLPAMIALVVVFVSAAVAAVRGRHEGGAAMAVSLFGLAGALQLGPAFYNSEALVFCWLIVGLAARAGAVPGPGVGPAAEPLRGAPGSRATMSLVVGAFLIGIAGQVLSLSSLAVDHQWQRLRWRLGMGMLPREADGRWSRPEATFSVDTTASAVVVRWHAGDQASPGYRADVSFYVDGALVERSAAVSGRSRESVLPLPAVAGFKRISVRVTPAFVPADWGGTDRRQLGVFIHSVTPAGEEPVGTRATAP